MHHTFFSVRFQWLRILCVLTGFFAAPSAWAVTLMPGGAPYLSAGVGVFNLVGAVDDGGYNHAPAEFDAEYQSGFRLYGIGYVLGHLQFGDQAWEDIIGDQVRQAFFHVHPTQGSLAVNVVEISYTKGGVQPVQKRFGSTFYAFHRGCELHHG